MKFVYEYRTADNARHEGVISAVSRDEAFAVLKGRGIRPSRVTEAPGVLNKLFGKGKRWMLIAALCVVCAVLGAVYFGAAKERDRVVNDTREIVSEFDSPVRRQIIGDTAVIERGIRTGWENVFPHEGERFLASFAIPGVPAGLRNTNEDEIRNALSRSREESVHGSGYDSQQSGSLEARQIRAIVEGMKQELREFIANDKHTIVEYGQRLVQRQDQEIEYYNRAKSEINAAVEARMPQDELLSLWESRNAQLRNIGVKLVPLPED